VCSMILFTASAIGSGVLFVTGKIPTPLIFRIYTLFSLLLSFSLLLFF
jgi:hypothetical protein